MREEKHKASSDAVRSALKKYARTYANAIIANADYVRGTDENEDDDSLSAATAAYNALIAKMREMFEEEEVHRCILLPNDIVRGIYDGGKYKIVAARGADVLVRRLADEYLREHIVMMSTKMFVKQDDVDLLHVDFDNPRGNSSAAFAANNKASCRRNGVFKAAWRAIEDLGVDMNEWECAYAEIPGKLTLEHSWNEYTNTNAVTIPPYYLYCMGTGKTPVTMH